MSDSPKPPEEKIQETVTEQKLNDLMYSVETKTFLKFMKEFILQNILPANMSISDPLPDFSFEAIEEEIKKRLPDLKEDELEQNKIWMKNIDRKLEELVEKITSLITKKMAHMRREEIQAKEKEIEEMTEYRSKLRELITAMGEAKTKTAKEGTIRKDAHGRFKQLNLF